MNIFRMRYRASKHVSYWSENLSSEFRARRVTNPVACLSRLDNVPSKHDILSAMLELKSKQFLRYWNMLDLIMEECF